MSYIILMKQRFLKFYCEEFEDIIRKYKRGPLISVVLKIIYAGQLLSLMLNRELESITKAKGDFELLHPLIKVLDSIKLYPIFDYAFDFEKSLDLYIIVVLSINCLFLIYVVMRASLTILHASTEDKKMWIAFDDVSAIFFQFYLHVFAIPYTEVSIKGLYNNTLVFPSIFNIIVTIGTGIVITMHDFDYSYILKDFMAKRESAANIIFFIQDMILVCIIEVDMGQGIFWIHFLFIGYRVYDYLKQIPYYDVNVSTVYL